MWWYSCLFSHLRFGGGAFSEAVLKFSLHGAEVGHAAGARGSSADSLLGPVVPAELGAATETSIFTLLLVPVGLATSSANGVSLVVTFALGLSSSTLQSGGSITQSLHLPYLFSNKDNNNTHSLFSHFQAP